MAFTTTVGAGGTSLIGTSGVDTTAFAPGTLATAVFIGAQGDADIVNLQTNQANSYTILMGGGNDIITAAGFLNSSVKGDDGNDTFNLTGTIQSATVSGLNGIDTITVANVNGGLVNGNNDSDVITVSAGAAVTNNGLIVGGQGGDNISLAGTNAGAAATAVTLTSGRINGQDGADTITLNGVANMASAGATVNGGQGSDFINGAGATAANGNLVLSGDLGNDTVTGGAGADTIFGGEGDDLVTGGTGNDSLIGGSGVDTYTQGAASSTQASAQNVAVAAGAANTWEATDTITFGNGIDVVTGFAGGAGGDVIRGLTSAAGTLATALLGTQFGTGGANTQANTTYYVSGNFVAATGVFTITANGAGADTLILTGAGAGGAATFAGTESNRSMVLLGTNYSTLTAANF